jgi:hypothetical protein
MGRSYAIASGKSFGWPDGDNVKIIRNHSLRSKPLRSKRNGGDDDPLPWKTYSLIAMLERRLHRQNSFRQVYRKNGKKVIRLVPQAATPSAFSKTL